ncbi:MAG: hypothetical protein ACKV2V_26900, partial [Blastocatellia bacterium]
FQDDGPSLTGAPLPASDRCASAFSGGKDSLLQAGLLTELTRRPLFVPTTSPMPPLEDHLTPRRAFVLRQISRRRDAELVEVVSNYRGVWKNDYAYSIGYRMSINEMTDTFLYLASLLAVSVAKGVPHLFLASEIEVNETLEIGGRTVQHPHFMYSIISLGVMSALLRPWGIEVSSLTCPLHSFQVQELLWTRYADIRDLQYSCWRVSGDDSICNACSQCLRIALSALALGADPADMGADMIRLLNANREWKPIKHDGSGPLSPSQISSLQLNSHVMRTIMDISGETMAACLERLAPDNTPEKQSALAAYAELRARARAWAPEPAPGFRPEYEIFIDPLLRQGIGRIYTEHFTPATPDSYAGALSRSAAALNHIIEPLQTESFT